MSLALVAAVSLIALVADDQEATAPERPAAASGAAKISLSDAFRRNHASIKVAMDFEYGGVKFDGEASQVWADEKPAVEKTPYYPLVGQWACDGAVEWYRFSSPDALLLQAAQTGVVVEKGAVAGKAAVAVMPFHFVPLTEALWDGHTIAWHGIDPLDLTRASSSWKTIEIGTIGTEPGPLLDGRGPFYWGFSWPFPDIIEGQFPKVVPTRRSSIRGGHPVEVEVYRRNFPGGHRLQLEVSYDPAIGYLPRFARVISVNPKGPAIAKEMYLTVAERCEAGGFVPTEWYDRAVGEEHFLTRYPNYNDDTVLLTVGARAGCSRFRGSNLVEIEGDVALTDLREVETLSTNSGQIPLPKNVQSLSLPSLEDDGLRPTRKALNLPQDHDEKAPLLHRRGDDHRRMFRPLVPRLAPAKA